MKSKLAHDLTLIALGDLYSEAVLCKAIAHPACTDNDRRALYRFMYGQQNSTDHIRLQDLAIEIERYI